MIEVMGQRVGIDLTSVAAVRDAVSAHGEAYLDRVYTPRERADCGDDPARLAGRFAAKEAALKVLRPTSDTSLPWNQIEVVRAPGGWVELELSARAAGRARELGLAGFSVSLSHEGEVACAVVSCEVLSQVTAPIGPPATEVTCRCQPV